MSVFTTIASISNFGLIKQDEKLKPFELNIKREMNAFIRDKNINITYHNFYKRIQYAIDNSDIDKMKKNFYLVFHLNYDYFYLKVKYIVNLILNVLEQITI